MSTESDIIKHLTDLLGELYGLPGYVVVALSCVIWGYMLRFIRRVNNDNIPIYVVGWAMFFNPLISPSPTGSEPWRIWLVRHVLVGMVIGGIAWLLHNKILKRFELKVPGLGPKLAAADAESDALNKKP